MIVSNELEKKIDYTEITERYEQRKREVDALHDKWKGHDLLNIFPEQQQRKMAVILDNQHLMMQEFESHRYFYKMGMELTQKMWKGSILFDIVSVQPMLRKEEQVFVLQYKFDKKEDTPPIMATPEVTLKMTDAPVRAVTKKMKPAFEESDREGYIDDLAKKIRREVTREVLTDLRLNVGTVMGREVDFETLDYESIFINVVEMSGCIHRKTLRGGCNWLVTTIDIAKIFAKAAHVEVDWDKIDEPTFITHMNHPWKLYADPLFPTGEILCGYQEEMLDGYFYAPYIAALPTPVVLDPESFCPRRGFLTRYGKRLVSSKPYGRIKYTNKVQEKPTEYHI